jgi:hypothetical protein
VKINFEGRVRVLDLDHIKLRHAMAIQEFTGLPLADWQRALFSRDMDVLAGAQTVTMAQVTDKMTAFTDLRWIVNMAAAHWLMIAQSGEEVPELDDGYDDVDVLGFTDALYTAALEEVKAKQVPDKPGPTARPARRTPPSRRTATPKTVTLLPDGPLPRLTGS